MAEEKEVQKVETRLAIRANGRGLVLQNLNDMYRFAQYVVASRLAPSSFTTAEQVIVAIQSGAELGLPPMRSLQSFCVVHGNARLWGDTPLALVRQSNNLEYIKEEIAGEISFDLSKTPDTTKAVCTVKRKDDAHEIKREFSVAEAKRANLWNKKTDKGFDSVWMKYPQRMLQLRARALALRDVFPDALGGATIAEEFEGMDLPPISDDKPKSAVLLEKPVISTEKPPTIAQVSETTPDPAQIPPPINTEQPTALSDEEVNAHAREMLPTENEIKDGHHYHCTNRGCEYHSKKYLTELELDIDPDAGAVCPACSWAVEEIKE